ncbi:MAG: porin family protein [Muribaculum sp.]|nr:porin family protein [Muribaculum sp.]
MAIALGLVIPQTVSAQKGEMSLGIGGGYVTYNNSGYAKVFYQYSITDHLRLAPEVGYMFKNEGKTGVEISVDLQAPFRIVKGIKVYPLVGATMNNWNYTSDGSITRFGGDIGAGFDFYMTPNLKIGLQGKYAIMKDASGWFADLGVAYVF